MSQRWVFRIVLFLSMVLSVALQMWTGSENASLFLVLPVIVVVAYTAYAIVKARRERRASGAPRPRIKVPLAMRLMALAVLLGIVAMGALTLSHKDEALEGTRWGVALKAAEGLIVVLALILAQWQRANVRRQTGAKAQPEKQTMKW